MSIKRVLVVGGTGMLGIPVVESLAEAGFEVSVGSRSEASVRHVFGDRFKTVVVDLKNPESTTEALDGFDAVHLNLPSGPRFDDCFRNETHAAENVAGIIKKTSIKRISYLSGANVSDKAVFPPSRAKWLAEEALRGSGVPVTVWRATWFMETLRKLVRFRFLVIPGSGNTAVHWISGSDLGRFVARSMGIEETAGKTLWAFGPRMHTLNEAVRIYRDNCYPGYLIFKMPLGMMNAVSRILRNREMWFGAQMMSFLQVVGEEGDPSEADELVGTAMTTVEDFANSECR